MYKKRNVLIAINIVLVVMMVCASWFAVKAYEKRLVSDFISERQSQLGKTDADLQAGKIGHTYVSAYFPKDQIGKRVPAVEAALYDCVAEKLGHADPKGTVRHLFFVSTKDEETHFPTVRQTRIETESYQVKGFSIKETKESQAGHLLLTEDNQVFTLVTFASNADLLRSLLSKEIEKTATEQGLSAEEASQKVAAFEAVDLANLEFHYEASQLTVKLPETVGIAAVTVPIASLFEAVKSQYLAEEDRKSYEAYQAEKEAKKNQKMIALTFDDGPSPATTPQVLATLKKHQAKATFFVLGQKVAGNEAILQQMLTEGHEIANHSWSHPNLTKLTADQIKQEVQGTQTAIEKATGQTPKLLRPPYGAVNQAVMAAAQMPAIYWSVDTLDWKSHNPQAILSKVQAGTHKGSIILMHDIHQTTADSLDAVLTYLSSKGYTFVTASELLGDNLNPQHIYYDQTSNGPAQ